MSNFLIWKITFKNEYTGSLCKKKEVRALKQVKVHLSQILF